MNGYSSQTFKWYNDKGEYFWVQYHFKTDQGIKNLTREVQHPEITQRLLHLGKYRFKEGK